MAEEMSTAEEKRNGHGPGFILGLVVGALTGAAAATLFAPPAGGEDRFGEAAGPAEDTAAASLAEGPPIERVRALLARVRSRVQEAAVEGREAAQEVEQRQRARYAELTREPPAYGEHAR